MSKSRHSEAQTIAALKQVEAGRTADDVARECGVSKHMIYAWKAKYGGMEASEAQRLKQLERMSIAVSSFRYRSRRSDELLRERLVRLAREKPRYGHSCFHERGVTIRRIRISRAGTSFRRGRYRSIEMSVDPISVLMKHQNEPKLGPIAKQVLQFLDGTQCKFF